MLLEPQPAEAPADLADALAQVRAGLLDDAGLVRATAGGRLRGQEPAHTRVEVRQVDLRGGRHLQVVTYDRTQARTANHRLGDEARAAVDALLAEPFGHWHVETTTRTVRTRVTKKHRVLLDVTEHAPPDSSDTAGLRRPDSPHVARAHDRTKARLLAEDDPVLVAVGISDHLGRVKPSRQAKYRQVDAVLRALAATIDDALAAGHLPDPTSEAPLRLVDLGCGNAYLTFAVHRYLAGVRGWPVRTVGVDVKEQSREHGAALADRLVEAGAFPPGSVTFVRSDIAEVTAEQVGGGADVVVALHACDTATDEALARAVAWAAPVALAAPCCHHDVAAQLRKVETDGAARLLIRHGILRERLADTLTDAFRAGLLQREGYRVDVVEFVASKHTPRNTLIRAVRTHRTSGAGQPERDEVDERDVVDERDEVDELSSTWGVRPRLATLLASSKR